MSAAQPGPAVASNRGWRTADALTMTAGVLLVLLVSVLWGLQSLGKVDPRDLERTAASPVDGAWLLALCLVVVGHAAAAGLPRGRRSDDAFLSGVGQAAASVAAGAGTLLGTSLGNIWLYGPDDSCVYAGCWPAAAQAAAAAAPAALAALAALTAALLASRWSWRARALLPGAVWLVGTGLLHAVWQPVLLPVFQAPP